jgi:subtilisin-like proprotein convertase family protein
MKKSILFSVLIITLLIGTNLFSQQETPRKWSEPFPTWLYAPPTVVWAPLPQQQDNYVNPNHEVRVVQTPIGVMLVNPSVRVCPRPDSWQSEVDIKTCPTNPLLMYGSSNAFHNTGTLWISEGNYVSTNGGITWVSNDTTLGAPITNHGGDPGPVIDKNGVLLITHLGYTSSGMFANYSTNNGQTWSNTYTIISGSQDKNLSGTDGVPTSPFYGRSYTVWTIFSGSFPASISYTTNGGVTWSAPSTMITPLSGFIARGPDIAVGPGGTVYCTWANNVGSSPETWLAFAKSTDGGVTFTGNEQQIAMSGLLCFGNCFAPYSIRMNSFPRIAVDNSGGPRNGWIYIAYTQRNLAPAGSDADEVCSISSNGGANWTTVRVNQDPINNGKLQFYDAVNVDNSGGVNVAYYSNANTVTPDSAEVIVARSVDGGATWTEVVASDHRFRPKPTAVSGIAGGYAGDYIGITSGNNKIWPLWHDDITGIYQAWTGSIDLGPAIQHTALGNTSQISGTRAVNCVIIPAGSPINPAATKLLYSRNNPVMTDSVLMTNTGGNNWTANITMSGAGLYRYYLKTADLLGRTATSPPGAPGTTYQFIATALFSQCSSNRIPIRDFTTSYDSMYVNANGTITDVNFRMDTLIHTFDGDVSFWVRSPAGTEVTLAAQRGGGGQNYIMTLFNDSAATPISGGSPPFTGSFRPETPLSVFTGQNLQGWWRLRVNDNAATDTGSVRRWCLFIETSGFIVSAGNNNNQVPDKFELGQNFPNPFNPTTNIKYGVPRLSVVKLAIYDILGREINVLVNELKQPGNYEIAFDASNIATGVYFYKLEAGDFVDVKKMVLMK